MPFSEITPSTPWGVSPVSHAGTAAKWALMGLGFAALVLIAIVGGLHLYADHQQLHLIIGVLNQNLQSGALVVPK